MLLESVDRDPVVAVVACGVGDETDMVGRGLAAVAPLFKERIKALAHQRASAMAGVLRDEEDRRRAFHALKIDVAFELEAFLDELSFCAERRFKLPAVRHSGRRRGKRRGLRDV